MSKLTKIIREGFAVLCYILGFTMGKKKPPVDKCVWPPAMKTPDPFLYSQQYPIGLGLAVTCIAFPILLFPFLLSFSG